MVRAMTKPPWLDDDAEADILRLLKGYLRIDSRGLPEQVYLDNDSNEEERARLMLARLLESEEPLKYEIRMSLAELFTPYPQFCERKITFAFRSRGARENFYANAKLMHELWVKVENGSTVTKAINEVAENYQLDDSFVMKLWSKLRPNYEAAVECLRRLKYPI